MEWETVESFIKDYDCDEARCIRNMERVIAASPSNHFSGLKSELTMAAAIVYCSHNDKQRSDVRRGIMRLDAISRYKKHLQSALGAAKFDEIFTE
jgi:hypothetical protein